MTLEIREIGIEGNNGVLLAINEGARGSMLAPYAWYHFVIQP